MTRRSKREVKRILDDLAEQAEANQGDGVDVVWRNGKSGEIVDSDGNSTEPDPDADTVVVIARSLVMSRDQAKREGREILGPAEEAPAENDAVRVAMKDS